MPKAGNPKGLTEDHFRYPGMKPQTKETAILMLVDSIEAASRTIDPPEREKFEEMIQRIIFTKLRAGQLDESGLSVADLRTLVSRMSDTLVNMFHHRIRYPWQEQRRGAPPVSTPADPGSSPGGAKSLAPETRDSQAPVISVSPGSVSTLSLVPSLPEPPTCNRSAAPHAAEEELKFTPPSRGTRYQA